LRSHAAGVALCAVIVCSVLGRFWVNRGFEGPQIYCDEYTYAAMARDFTTSGHLEFPGGPAAPGSLLYPLLIAPAWLVHTMSTTFDLVKLINATLISLTAVPVYLWAKRLVSPWWSLVAAALVLLLPGLVLSGMLMSENASLPTFTFAVFVIALAVEQPRLWRQGLVVVALVLAYWARAQGLVLLAILPTAVLLDIVLDMRAGVPRADVLRRTRGFAPLAAVVALGFLGYLAHGGFSLAHELGGYGGFATTHYDPLSVLLWTARHAGEAVLATGVASFCALLLLLFRALSGRLEGRVERAFVATAVAAVLWFLVQVAMFASAFNPQIHERYAMYAFPTLLVALAVCLGQQRLDRPRAETLAAVLSSLALAGFIIFGVFLHPKVDAVHASLTLHFFIRLPQHLPGGLALARLVLFLLAAAVALFFAIAPARFVRVLLPATVGLLLVLASRGAYLNLSANTRYWATSTGRVRSWIDDRIGSSPGTVGYVFVPGSDSYMSSIVLANTQFWNQSIGPVYTLGSQALCPLPLKTTLRLDEQTGALVAEHGHGSAREPYLATGSALAFAGKVVAPGGSPALPLVIYRPALPLRVTSSTVGVYPDGWTGPNVSYFQYPSSRPRPGRIDISLSRIGWTGPDVPGRVTVTVRPLEAVSRAAPTAEGRWIAHKGQTKVLRLPAPAPPFKVSVHVAPTFSAAQFGLGDPRPLGVQIAFSHVQGR
jgi:hypothetical protein